MMTNFWIAVASSFIAVYVGGITLQAPRKFLIQGGIVGVVCWVVYSIILEYSNNVIASFISSIAVAFLSNVFARLYKAPVTMFFIPGFLPIVPGVSVYRTVYFYISNNHTHGYKNLVVTLETAISIALAIVLVDSAFKFIFKLKKKKSL